MERICSANNDNNYIRPRNFASKNPAVSALQDLLFFHLTQIAFFVKNSSGFNKSDTETNQKLTRLIYLTNKSINFNIKTLMDAIMTSYSLKTKEENLYNFLCRSNAIKPKQNNAFFELRETETLSQMVSLANVINVQKSIKSNNVNVFGVKELIRQSISATSNYLEPIKREKNIPLQIYNSLYDILDFLGNEHSTIRECKNYCLKAGELHTQTIELLISTYEKSYGMIERKKVSTSYKKGNCILVIGEDFKFLKKLLHETEDRNINVYTYGILNAAHSFPEINKYKHLVGIYLGKYNNFSADIESFPGIVILTSGNLENLNEIFRGRIYTTEDISMLGITKVDENNLKKIINNTLDAPGFKEDKENCYLEIGFGLRELEKYTDKLYNFLNSKKAEKIFILSGCNDFTNKKNHLKKLMQTSFNKCIFITIDCIMTPYKFFKNTCELKYTLNMGQFVNIYYLIRLLYGIAGKFRKNVNELPVEILSGLNSADSVATLLVLLSLGIKNIKIHSDLPNYLTTSLIKLFSKDYNLSKISHSDFYTNDDINKQA